MRTDYQKQATDFSAKYGVELEIGNPDFKHHFEDDKEPRYVFPCILSRNGETYIFDFGQSIASGAEEPTMYDVLTVLTKGDPGTFEDFCSEYGYDEDSRKAERTYDGVKEEWANVENIFSDIPDELQEIN